MTEHTPGKWKAKPLTYTVGYVILHETDHGDRRVDDKKGEFSRADAHLIAAAPDLLEALYYFMNSVDDGDDPTEAYARAERAIAKTKGNE
jgi:hypothetical protein